MDSGIKHILATLRNWLVQHASWALLIIIIAASGLVASTYHYFRHTWDEPEHLAAGMQLIDKHIYTYDQQHPPLARVAMAIGPYLAGARSFGEPGPSGEQEGRDLLYRTGNYDLLLTLARVGMLPFFAVLLFATWAWARHVYGVGAAYIATLLLIATPPILGHAGVAALDIPGAALCTLASYCLLRWLETRTWKHAVLTGIAAGLAIGTKLSALPFIAVIAGAWSVCWFIAARDEKSSRAKLLSRWAGQSFSILCIALVCAMFCYGYSFRIIVDDVHPYNTALSYLFGKTGWAHDVTHNIARYIPMPVGFERLTWSIEALVKHNTEGHWSYLLGEFSKTGFRYFYLVALLVKTPIPLLILGITGLFFISSQARPASNTVGQFRGWIIAAPATAFAILLLFCSFYSHINIGLRHVFVLYPLLCIAAAALVMHLWQRYPQRLVRAAIIVLLGLQAMTLWTVYPDYLPYFNAFASKHPERILIDSDLDWGQDLKRLEIRLNELGVHKFGFVYRGSADVMGEHLPGVWMVQPFNPATGWIAASIFARDTVSQGQAFGWLKQYSPVERIGKSIDLYFIPETSKAAH